jgi:hypothetical protein
LPARSADHDSVGDDSNLYRSQKQARAVRFVCTWGPVFLVAYAALPVGFIVTRVAALVAAAGLPVAYRLRLRRAGVSISGGNVHVVNVTRTHDVAVENVDRFTVGPGRFFPRIGKLRLRDGSAIHIWAIQSSANQHVRPNDRGAHDVVDALNAALGIDRAEAA